MTELSCGSCISWLKKALDKAVDLCYRAQTFGSETGRVEFLFDLYSRYVDGLVYEGKKR